MAITISARQNLWIRCVFIWYNPPLSYQFMQKSQEKNGKNQGIFQLLRQRGIEFARRIVYNSFNY